MRAWWVLAGSLILMGCPEGPRCPECPVRPELRLLWTDNGESIASAGGDISLDPVTAGCARKTRLRVANFGLGAVTFSVASSSPSMIVPTDAFSLAPAEAQDLDVHVSSEGASSSVEAGLTIDVPDEPPLQFQLHAPVVSADPGLPRSLDFGAVAVGQSGQLSAPSLLGLTADFAQDAGVLRFSPADAGHVELAASVDWMLDCPALSSVSVVADGVTAVLFGPRELNFGDLALGNAIELDVNVQNLSFDEVQVTLPGSDFTIVSSSTTPSAATRDPGGLLVVGSRTQRVRFSPTTVGAVSGQLEATAGPHRLVIPLRAVGTP